MTLLESVGFDLRYGSPRGAIQSDRSSAIVKLFFWLGSVIWSLTGFNLAPGFLIVAAKNGVGRSAGSGEAAIGIDGHASKNERSRVQAYPFSHFAHRS
jgi:hypothetical protein